MPSKVRRWSDRRREVRGTPWTKDEDARLAEMLRSGMCVKDAADQLGRTGSSVYHRIKNAGIANPSMRHWEQWEVDQLREAVASGLSAKEIAGRMGRTVPSVVTKMSALGLRSQSQTDWQGMPWDKVRACAERGIPEKDVARVLGVRQSSLSTAFRRRFGMTYTEAGGKLR